LIKELFSQVEGAKKDPDLLKNARIESKRRQSEKQARSWRGLLKVHKNT